MRRWIKLHTDIMDNPTIGRLSWEEKGIWLMLLALAGRIEDYNAYGELTGKLDTPENVAWHLRCSPEELAPVVEHFIQIGLLACDVDGVLYIPDFAAAQAIDTSAERVQRYRQRRKAATATAQERDADVTPPLRERDVPVTPALHERYATVTPALHERYTSVTPALHDYEAPVTPASHARYTGVTPALRDVAESEQNQNRIRTEQNQNNIQNRTQQQQNRTDTKRSAVAAVDNSLNQSVVNRADALHGMANRTKELSVAADESETPSAMVHHPEALPAPAHSIPRRRPSAAVTAPWPEGQVAPPEKAYVAVGGEDMAQAEAPYAVPPDPDAALDAERAQLRKQLIALGVNATEAERLVQIHPPERLRDWCDRMRQQSSPGDPAHSVTPRIARNRPPPQPPA
ncbi:MAG: hypothetical protein DDG58_00105, partial [Ardenticatenia bacterium]